MTLPTFEGEEVARSLVRITKAGDGLTEALKFAPEALHPNERVYVLLECEVSQVNHKRRTGADGDYAYDRVHTLEPVRHARLDERDAKGHLDTAEDELRKLRDSMKGQGTLDNGEEE